MAVISIDLGGTKIAGALFEDSGNVLAWETRLLEGRSGKDVSDLLGSMVTGLWDNPAARDGIEGIGICVPGIVYSKKGTVWAPNIPGWVDFPLRRNLLEQLPEERRGIPVHIESDRTCYILGEVWQGCAKGCDDAVYLAVGTGIGAGILIDGHVLHGKGDSVGAAGWMALEPPYDRKYVGVGCFEYYASGNGIGARAREAVAAAAGYDGPLSAIPVESITAREVFSACFEGDPLALRIIDKAVLLWGMASANLVSLFNPEKLIFGGGVFGPAVQLLPRIREEALKWGQPIAMEEVEFCASTVSGGDAALMGAAWMVLRDLGKGKPSPQDGAF